MRKSSRSAILGELIGHLATGAGLGIWLSLTLIVSDTGHIFEMIVNSAAPKMTAAIFVGLFASILAVGASLTGLIFTAIEDS